MIKQNLLLWGLVVSTTLSCLVLWNWIQILSLKHIKQGKVCENIFLFNGCSIFKGAILPPFWHSLEEGHQNQTRIVQYVGFLWGLDQKALLWKLYTACRRLCTADHNLRIQPPSRIKCHKGNLLTRGVDNSEGS